MIFMGYKTSENIEKYPSHFKMVFLNVTFAQPNSPKIKYIQFITQNKEKQQILTT